MLAGSIGESPCRSPLRLRRESKVSDSPRYTDGGQRVDIFGFYRVASAVAAG